MRITGDGIIETDVGIGEGICRGSPNRSGLLANDEQPVNRERGGVVRSSYFGFAVGFLQVPTKLIPHCG
jgi:hypothetical protein